MTNETVILRINEVIRKVGISKSSIYSAMEQGSFPNSIKLGERAVGWRLSEIEAWIDKRTLFTKASQTQGDTNE